MAPAGWYSFSPGAVDAPGGLDGTTRAAIADDLRLLAALHGIGRGKPEAYVFASRARGKAFVGKPIVDVRRALERAYRHPLGPGLCYAVEVWWKRLWFPTRRAVGTVRAVATARAGGA